MNAGDYSHGPRRILLDGAGTRREAVLQALLQLGAGSDADAIADALDSYVRRLAARDEIAEVRETVNVAPADTAVAGTVVG